MLFKYDKDKYSFMNVYKELGKEIFNYGWVINYHKGEGWEYHERVISLSRVEGKMALCWAPKTRIEIPLANISLTKEDAVKLEINRIKNKLSEEDKEMLESLLVIRDQFRELDFVGEYC